MAVTAFSRLLGKGCTLKVGTGTGTMSSADIVSTDDIVGGQIEAIAAFASAQALGETFPERANIRQEYRLNIERMLTTGYPLAAQLGNAVWVKIADGQGTPQTIFHGEAVVEGGTIGPFTTDGVLTENINFLSHTTPTTEPAT